MSYRLNVIGAGRLGQTLSYLFAHKAAVLIQSVCTRSLTTAEQAVQLIGSGTPCAEIQKLNPANLMLLASKDAELEHICRDLSQSRILQAGNIVFHCSGVLSSDLLKPLQEQGVYIASIHPMQTFASAEKSIHCFEGTYCAMEGDVQALEILEPLFQAIGAHCYVIDKNKKALYHAAGVFASNYMLTLAHEALTCLNEAGVDSSTGLEVITHLMQGMLHHLKETGSVSKALTGPLQRGDLISIQKHLEAFSDPLMRKLYALLAEATLPLTENDASKLSQLRQLILHNIL
jgi:predicted short-subunit dehydrogenase-like oxidoreductase (DUF2520 family)